jgi:hypothetical protein
MSDSTDRPQAVAVRFKWKQQSDQHTLYTLPAEAGLKTQFFETYQQPLREHYGNFTVESAWHGVNRWELSHTFRLSIAGALAAAWSQSTDPTADETFQAAVEMALQKMQEAFPPPDWVESTLKLDPEPTRIWVLTKLWSALTLCRTGGSNNRAPKLSAHQSC